MNRKYYKRINNLDIALEKTNHKYVMINQWARDNSHKWGIASFKYDEDGNYKQALKEKAQELMLKIRPFAS